jgi:hypothetical protein
VLQALTGTGSLALAGADPRLGGLTLDQRLAAIDAELEQIRAQGVDAEMGEPIRSPCDCTVRSVDGGNGDPVEPGRQLALLVGTGAPTVHALVLSDEARAIEIGDRSHIRLANGTSLEGRVQRMAADPHWPGFAGLRDDVFAVDRYARIEIRPDTALTAPVGTAAEVTVQTNPLWDWLRSMTGL